MLLRNVYAFGECTLRFWQKAFLLVAWWSLMENLLRKERWGISPEGAHLRLALRKFLFGNVEFILFGAFFWRFLLFLFWINVFRCFVWVQILSCWAIVIQERRFFFDVEICNICSVVVTSLKFGGRILIYVKISIEWSQRILILKTRFIFDTALLKLRRLLLNRWIDLRNLILEWKGTLIVVTGFPLFTLTALNQRLVLCLVFFTQGSLSLRT